MKRAYAGGRRARRSPALRLRPFRLAIAVALLLALGLGAFAALWPGFYPRRIVVAGNQDVSSGQIARAAAILPGRSIWVQSTRAMARRIEAIPEIAWARVRRVPPSTLVLRVGERMPFAALQLDGERVPVDRDLRVLDPGRMRPNLPLIVLGGVGYVAPGAFVNSAAARGLRDADDALVAGGLTPAALRYDRFGGLDVTLTSGVRLLLGDPDALDRKVRLVTAILTQLSRSHRRLATIDLRAPATPVVVYR